MSNTIQISTIGAAPLVERHGTGQPAVARMVDHLKAELAQVLPDRPDVIVVPECCDRYAQHGEVERRDYYLARGEQVRDFLGEVARTERTYIAYAAVRALEDGTWRNSIQLLDREGEVAGVYDKCYPTIGEMEWGVVPGASAPLIECDFGRVACAICFDLNFFELRDRYAEQGPDLVVFASMYHGGLMQPYWAYACRAHLVSAIAGQPSHVIDPLGRVVASTTNYFDHVTQAVNLDARLAHLDYHWEKLEALKAKYGREVSIVDPGFLGSVLVRSEAPERTAEQLLAEFEIEPLDAYFDRARAARERYSGAQS
jgi:predicted amidohydrolase